jgi:putative acetyltransferase
MTSGPSVELVVTSFDDPLVTGLRGERAAEAGPLRRHPTVPGAARAGASPGSVTETPPDAGLTFLVARRAGEAVGYAGLRRLGDDTAEVERVYVRPGYRGPDISRLLLAGVEDLARRRGFAVARLEAGDLRGAGLYVSNGYVRIAPFGRHSARSVCLEKSLRVEVPAARPSAPDAPWDRPPYHPSKLHQ